MIYHKNQQPCHVTSDLAAHAKQADDGQGGGGIDQYRDTGHNSRVFKILTSKLFDIKILQTLLAAPAPVKAFRGVGGGGYTARTQIFPE
jgi:hypothetical protein